jgi:hypothetical protein
MSSNAIWLTMLRGMVERSIDRLLSDESLSTSRNMFESMQPVIKSSDDAIFGYVYGYIIGSLETIFNGLNRQPTNEEMKEIVNAVFNRIQEIKSRIYQTKT